MRRRYITHPRFQFWFVIAYVRGALISVGGGAALLALSLYLIAQDSSIRLNQSEQLMGFLSTMGLMCAGVAAVTVLIFGVMGVYLSYKMAGPIRRLEDWLVKKNLGEDVDPLILRPGDEWIPVVELLNRLSKKS